MELLPLKSWKQEFARSTEADRYREILRRHQDDVCKKDKDEQERDERRQDLDELVAFAMATQSDVDAYLVTTAHYQEATYAAIIESQQALFEVRRERQDMEKAYVLPDGRRVFESEDGIRVFDEGGSELDASVVSGDEIDDRLPKHEQFQALGEQEVALLQERADLLEYQQKVDEARERLEAGAISQKDFDAMKKDLSESMPDRVHENLPDEFKPERELGRSAELVVDAAPVSRPGPIPGS